MLCARCGQSFESSAKVCPHCGFANTTPVASSATPSSATPDTTTKLKKMLPTVAIGLLLIVGVYGCFQGRGERALNNLKNEAYVEATRGNDAAALAKFKEAFAQAKPDSFDHHLIGGEIAVLESKPEEALAHFSTAEQLEPDNFQINNALALFYMDLNDTHPQYVDYKKSLVYAKKAADATDQDTAKENLAVAHFFNDQYDEAIAILEKLDDNGEASIPYFLGLAYLGKEDDEKAKPYLKTARDRGMDLGSLNQFVDAP